MRTSEPTMPSDKGAVFYLALATIGLVLLSSLAGIALDDGGAPALFTSLRGEQASVYGGQGLYRFDSVAKAVTFRGFDWANLFVCLPLTVLGLVASRRGSIRGRRNLAEEAPPSAS